MKRYAHLRYIVFILFLMSVLYGVVNYFMFSDWGVSLSNSAALFLLFILVAALVEKSVPKRMSDYESVILAQQRFISSVRFGEKSVYNKALKGLSDDDQCWIVAIQEAAG